MFHNASKSKLLTLIKKEFICSTVLQTVFVLFASQLTAALPFSMRTSSVIYIEEWYARDIPLGLACTRHEFDTSISLANQVVSHMPSI